MLAQKTLFDNDNKKKGSQQCETIEKLKKRTNKCTSTPVIRLRVKILVGAMFNGSCESHVTAM